MRTLLIFVFLIYMSQDHLTLARDVCNSNTVLQPLTQFRLTQRITKDAPLNLALYSDLVNGLTRDSTPFEQIARNYTSDAFFKTEEPDTLFPLGLDRVIFKLEGTSQELDLTCQAKNARMVALQSSDEIPFLTAAMKTLEMT